MLYVTYTFISVIYIRTHMRSKNIIRLIMLTIQYILKV